MAPEGLGLWRLQSPSARASRAEWRRLVTPTSFSVPRDVAQQLSILEPQGCLPPPSLSHGAESH